MQHYDQMKRKGTGLKSPEVPMKQRGYAFKSSRHNLPVSQRRLRMPQWRLRVPQWQFLVVHLNTEAIHQLSEILQIEIWVKHQIPRIKHQIPGINKWMLAVQIKKMETKRWTYGMPHSPPVLFSVSQISSVKEISVTPNMPSLGYDYDEQSRITCYGFTKVE